MPKDADVDAYFKLFQLGDPNAFLELFRFQCEHLFKVAFILLNEDSISSSHLTAEVLYKAWAMRNRLPNYTEFRSFLYKTVKNSAIAYNKCKRTTPVLNTYEIDKDLLISLRLPPDCLASCNELIQNAIKGNLNSLRN
jgi:DNA-directed RNA polymerase specialized sigma24 family protein